MASTERRQIRIPDCEIVAIDNSPAMLARCGEIVAREPAGIPVTLRCADNLEAEIRDASLVVLNFILQFVAPVKRAALLCRIYPGMKPGGMLVLSEKIHFEDPEPNALFIDLRHRFAVWFQCFNFASMVAVKGAA